MLAYAFRILNEDCYARVASEEFENTHNLFAAILAKGMANQVRRGLGKEYTSKTEAIASLKGKINVSASIMQQSVLNKQLVCDFDEFTENALINKILKTTAFLLMHSADVSDQNKRALKRVMYYFCGVEELDPHRIPWSRVKYHRNNTTYKMLLNICYLVIKGMLLSEEKGGFKLRHYIDDQCMHRLYEKFVLEYYRKHHPECSVSASYIDWDIDDGIIEFLPAMKSDITLECTGKTLIIDTKYYEHTMQVNTQFDSTTIHSNNLYQIFTYVKNRDTAHSGHVSGVLLYAKTDEEIAPDNTFMMSGNRISVKTLDLNAKFTNIEGQLETIIDQWLQ
jgi:5-methylcytosine-specific restriction enzyme subunit McrC